MSAKLTITIPVWLDFIFTLPVIAYRQLKYGYSFRKIDLGEGVWTIVEPADFYRLRNFRWIVYGTGRNLYAVRHKIVGPNKTKMSYMHREIMKPTDDRLVDHRNCDSLDNRRSNLRFATRAENMRNRRKRKNTTSRFLGVFFDKQTKKWTGAIVHDKKKVWLGRFDSEVEAAKAYDAAAKKYHKDFARLNFPQDI